jgi:alkanesulfonate monooxygenase
MKKQAILNLFAATMHRGSWREPDAPSEVWMDFELWRFLARTAERGKFHSVFVPDVAGLAYDQASEHSVGRSSWLLRMEPITLVSALAASTERIGVLATASTTYGKPYSIARAFATLDHLSGGRAGWNVVTSHMLSEAPNYGLGAPLPHADRYRQAEEFVEVVKGLWDSWEDDAFVRDKESGVYVDLEKMHRLDHDGEFFSVAGPLNLTRPPQGYPVFAQAGASVDGRAFAAKVAEMMYTIEDDIDRARALYAEMKGRAEDSGRSADHLKLLPHLHLVVAETDAEAQEKLEELNGLVDPVVGLEMLNQYLYFDLSDYPLDGPLPEIPPTEHHQTRVKWMIEMARSKNMSIRQMIQWQGSYGAVAGSAESIADRIEEWLTTNAADGFNLFFPDAWRSVPNFVDFVVPELQRRGLFRTEYSGATLRENLGLPRPVVPRKPIAA